MLVSLNPAGSVAACSTDVSETSASKAMACRMAMNMQPRCHDRRMPSMRRIFIAAAFIFAFCAMSVHAQDVLTIGSDLAQAGGVASLRVSILDRSGTPLGIDATTSNRIQGFAFKVLFPTELITSVTFTRAGIAATITPLFETALHGSGWSSCIVSFHEATNPIPFQLSANAPGDRVGTLTVTLRGDAPAGSVIRLILDPPSAMLSNRTATTRETVANGALSLVNGTVTVASLPTPTSLVATAAGTSNVNVNWSAVSGANHYEVWRSVNGDEFGIVGSPSSPAFTDATVSADTTYLYRVRAVGGGQSSAFSNIDAATTMVFTDDPIVASSTKVKAVHLTELRAAVNAMRAAADLAPLGSDPSVAVGAIIRAHHITDLRTALDAARSAIGLPAIAYTDPSPTLIRAVHITQLRNGVK